MVTARSLGGWTSIDSDKMHVKVGSFSREQSQQLLRVRQPDAWSEPQSSEVISFLLKSLDDVPLAITYTIAAILRYGALLVTEAVDAIQERDEFVKSPRSGAAGAWPIHVLGPGRRSKRGMRCFGFFVATADRLWIYCP